MGLRRRWSWEKIDWNERLRNDDVAFHEELIEKMNQSELVEVLNLRGVRAHRGIDRESLVDGLLASISGKALPVEHPLDLLRRRLLWFIDTFREKIRDQLVDDCDCDCQNKHDAEVLYCYEASRESIERKMVEHGYED